MNIDDAMPVILNLVHMDFCCFYLFVCLFFEPLEPRQPSVPLEVPAYGHDYPFTAQTWDATGGVLKHRRERACAVRLVGTYFGARGLCKQGLPQLSRPCFRSYWLSALHQ